MPASDTSAIAVAALQPRDQRGRLPRLVVLVQARRRRRDRVARKQMSGAPRVLGRDHRRPRAAPAARGRVMSSRLPIGVATTNSVPGMKAGAFIVPLADRGGSVRVQSVARTAAVGAMPASEPLPHFVDDLLGYLHETHPTHATLDGVHTHDDLLEDLSRHGDRQPRRTRSPATCAASTKSTATALTDDRAARAPHARRRTSAARMFELEEVRTWERNPQFYADILASSLAGQALFTHAPAPERARRVLSKLRQTPRLIQAARDNIKDPPGIFVKVGIETMRGALKFIDDDLPRAFSSVDDLHLLGDLADAQTEASHADRRVHRVPRNRAGAAGARLVPPRAREVRAEAAARRGASRCRSIGCSPSRRAS